MRASSVDQIILETLAKENAHLTSGQIYDQIRVRLPALNPSTVYRALERLAKSGKISISDMGTGSEVYESLENEAHHHLICQKCGRVYTINNDEVGQFFREVERSNQFKIKTNHLILFGLCSHCQ
ncbi:MAG TPA: transcriptional repressor [Anaerolineaceae bacterium]|nr:transcriptional repressor [Anaerolineaceae bacterium]